jgi:hypothetical protein
VYQKIRKGPSPQAREGYRVATKLRAEYAGRTARIGTISGVMPPPSIHGIRAPITFWVCTLSFRSGGSPASAPALVLP